MAGGTGVGELDPMEEIEESVDEAMGQGATTGDHPALPSHYLDSEPQAPPKKSGDMP